MRERGRCDRTMALTAWEDGESAVLQVEAARRKRGRVLDDAGARIPRGVPSAIESPRSEPVGLGPPDRAAWRPATEKIGRTAQHRAIHPNLGGTFRIRFLSGNSILAQGKPLVVDTMGLRPASAHS